MQNRVTFEIEFRMNRLSMRLERLATHFEQLASFLELGEESSLCLKYVQECKFFIEWTGIDLDVDRAYELVQMQRQLVQMQQKWEGMFRNSEARFQVAQHLRGWASSLRSMTTVFA